MSFAESVQNHVRLDYLTCLTVADIVQQTVPCGIAGSVLCLPQLYDYTSQQFRQGMNLLLDNKERSLKIVNWRWQFYLKKTRIIGR